MPAAGWFNEAGEAFRANHLAIVFGDALPAEIAAAGRAARGGLTRFMAETPLMD